MTDREAIERLFLMAKGGTNFSAKNNEACRMGAEALQEREERARGCEFCLNTPEDVAKILGRNYCTKCGRKLKGE